MTDQAVPSREIFEHMSPLSVAAFYFLAAVALGLFAYGLWLRVKKYRTGRAADCRNGFWRHAIAVVLAMAAHSTLKKRNSFSGIAHWLIFWGFVVLFLGSLVIAVDHDVLRPISPALQFWKGTFYEAYSAVLDVMGLGLLVGLGMMAVRRWGQKNRPSSTIGGPTVAPMNTTAMATGTMT